MRNDKRVTPREKTEVEEGGGHLPLGQTALHSLGAGAGLFRARSGWPSMITTGQETGPVTAA